MRGGQGCPGWSEAARAPPGSGEARRGDVPTSRREAGGSALDTESVGGRGVQCVTGQALGKPCPHTAHRHTAHPHTPVRPAVPSGRARGSLRGASRIGGAPSSALWAHRGPEPARTRKGWGGAFPQPKEAPARTPIPTGASPNIGTIYNIGTRYRTAGILRVYVPGAAEGTVGVQAAPPQVDRPAARSLASASGGAAGRARRCAGCTPSLGRRRAARACRGGRTCSDTW